MATEVARCPCNPGIDLNDPTTEASKALEATSTELTQQAGFQRLYWGMEVENPSVLRLFVDWDSVEDHEKFQNSEAYGPFCERLAFVLDLSQMQLYHTHMTPHPPDQVLSNNTSPVTEIITAYFPVDYSSADQQSFETDLQKLISAIESNSSAFHGFSGGWAKEDVPMPKSADSATADDEKAKLYLAFLGWDSVEAHLAFREHEAFKENRHWLRGAKDMKSISVVHASCEMRLPEGK